MTKPIHTIYIASMALIVVVITAYLSYIGYSFYTLPIEERFYHPQYDWFKPSGIFGHGLGIVGTLLIAFGVFIYIARKKYGFLARFIRIKYLLEFHIFLCTLGPIMVLFHTSFKFGGIVSIAFWSMVAVVLSGVIGRFIYIQIPRNIEGQELDLANLAEMHDELIVKLSETNVFSDLEIQSLKTSESKTKLSDAKRLLKSKNVSSSTQKEVIAILKKEKTLATRIGRLSQMQKLFKYWHVAHKPFALIMLIIVIVHIGVTWFFGYKWIFS